MAKKTGTAREFVLNTLRQHSDRELRVADLHDVCSGQYSKENLAEALKRLLGDGKVVKAIEADRSTWWALALDELNTAPPKEIVKRPTMVIRNTRW